MNEPTRSSDKPADAITATPPHEVAPRSRHLRVSRQDLDMYAALVGVPQTLLIADEPAVPKAALRVDRTRLSSWVHGLSRRAKQQFSQAKVRLARATRKPRA